MGSEARDAIEARIPHRAPFLFVDRVVDRSEDSILTEWRVPPGADFFRGHYPGNPLLPGVIAAELAFQSAALLIAELDATRVACGPVPVLARIADARFRRPVRPGETLAARVILEERVGPAHHFAGEITNESGERVLSLRFVVALAEPGIST